MFTEIDDVIHPDAEFMVSISESGAAKLRVEFPTARCRGLMEHILLIAGLEVESYPTSLHMKFSKGGGNMIQGGDLEIRNDVVNKIAQFVLTEFIYIS